MLTPFRHQGCNPRAALWDELLCHMVILRGPCQPDVSRRSCAVGATMNWKAALALVAVVSLLAACQTTNFVPGGPVMGWAKSGTSRAQRRLAYDDCVLKATAVAQVGYPDPVPYTGYPAGVDSIPTAPRFEPTPEMHIETPPAAFGVNVGHAVEHLGAVEEGAGEELFDQAASSNSSRSTQQLYVKVCMEKKGYALAHTKWCPNPHDEATEDCVIPTTTR